MRTIAFTGGGTGGHIYPGLAIIAALPAEYRIIWIGSNKGMDRDIVERAGIIFYGIPSGKLRRYFSLRNVLDVFKVAAGFFCSVRILKKERPLLLFSKGGFVSVPPVAAASLLRIKIFSHESDVSPGLATRLNLRASSKVFIPYEESLLLFADKYRSKLVVSGNPIRPAFWTADSARGRAFLGLSGDERLLLVLGGSQGAAEINELVWAALPDLAKTFVVVHQTGVTSGGAAASERYRPFQYIGTELPDVLAAAELVLCRSGAGTLWECAALQKPMLLVPLSGSGTRGDQVENARIFEGRGAALMFRAGEATPRALCERIEELDIQRRATMCAACADIALLDAAKAIAKEIVGAVSSA
ncbi:UDP-N-acetylglucosamine--N-acetylmuramyl-(pentapeptide) pyrophosphoryl-undecaprenol N-acetylglucosamine transferase [Spirochaetia bacterium]|nr:UDP-N-acetylglucosamine--N-acetylmuramyl-(pentapeptide) pyrophosphoryl-undecaprenol N-acetylglucosamine transferase [Spirochaetia bacterium]